MVKCDCLKSNSLSGFTGSNPVSRILFRGEIKWNVLNVRIVLLEIVIVPFVEYIGMKVKQMEAVKTKAEFEKAIVEGKITHDDTIYDMEIITRVYTDEDGRNYYEYYSYSQIENDDGDILK